MHLNASERHLKASERHGGNMVGKLLSCHLNALQKRGGGEDNGWADIKVQANFSSSKGLFRWDSKDGMQIQYQHHTNAIQMNRGNTIQNTPQESWHKINPKHTQMWFQRTIQMLNAQMQTAVECKSPPCSCRCNSSSPLWRRNFNADNLTIGVIYRFSLTPTI